MSVVDRPLELHKLASDAAELTLTADELCDEVVQFVEHVNRADFAMGPYIYSLCLMRRGQGAHPSEPTDVYHDQLYAVSRADLPSLLAPIARESALIDVSLRRSAKHNAEHKLVTVAAPSR